MQEEFHNKKILIIEDHDNLRSSLNSWLLELFNGIEIYSAATGEEGLTLAYSVNPDIILIDICLPDIDGIEITRQIKGRNYETNIIVLTSSDGLNYKEESYKAGADGFINKREMYLKLPQAVMSILGSQN